MQKTVIVACNIFKSQLQHMDLKGVNVEYLDQILHRRPEQLREELQSALNRYEGYSRVLFGYGRCSNAVLGLKTNSAQELIIPRTEDCISIFLGSKKTYLKEFHDNPGTYYFTRGWVEYAQDPLKEYFRTMEKYDEETARWTAQEMMRYYKRAAYINTGNSDEAGGRKYAQKFAQFFDLQYCELQGADTFLHSLINGPRKESEFVYVPPKSIVTSAMVE